MKCICLFFALFGALVLSAPGQTAKRRAKQKPRPATPVARAQAITPLATAAMYNVKEDFSAVGDGVADDTEPLTRAVQAGKTGKPVFLPAGTYRVDHLNLSGRVMLVGEGLSKSIIKSAGQNRPVIEVTDIGSGVTLRDLQIQGTATAANAAQLSRQHGFHQFDQVVPGIALDHVLIKNVGGNGLRIENAFSSTFVNVETDFTYRDAFDIVSGGPNITIINSYVHSLGSPHTAAYRLRAGRPTLINANGIDGPQRDDAHTTWAIIGQTIGFGDPRDTSAFPTFINPNVESFTDFGIYHLETSTSNIIGAQIFPHGTAQGVEPLRYNGGSGARGVIDTGTVICCDRSRYRDGREIRAYGAAPVVLLGAVGVFQGFDQGITDYFNFETNTVEPLRRIDDWLTRREVAGSYTMKTTETKLIDVRANAPTTITLLNAAAARDGASVTVKDGAGTAQINRILINAQGSRIDGATEQAINSNFGALTFYSDGQNWLSLRPAIIDDPRNRPTSSEPRRNFQPRASGAVRLDFRFGNIQHLVLQGDVALTLANLRDGASYTLIFEQDAAGGHAIALPAAIRFPGGVAPRWTIVPGARDVVRCDSDGANLYCRADLDVK